MKSVCLSTVIARSEGNLHFDRDNVDQRQKSLNNAYKDLVNLSQVCPSADDLCIYDENEI